MGWSSGSRWAEGFVPIFDYCDEESVKKAIDAFVSPDLGLYEAGYRHFHLDDCWAGGRNSSGYLFPEKDHFPNGIKTVIDYAHQRMSYLGFTHALGLILASVDARDLKITGNKTPMSLPSGA